MGKKGTPHRKFSKEAPLQIVVSDMTILKNNGKQWEWTLLLDSDTIYEVYGSLQID